ncbi:hypothetical protein [Ruania alba]|uniref:Uncharacterized protein n=1 Tax=Ruania alba TaxID=648782 RepID=A0A1H5G559_9MICO|nr:hypothetical protein [Ruania alba]SEE10779.1 hypothetical protein SAMN04488554_1542 [Ruania alba]
MSAQDRPRVHRDRRLWRLGTRQMIITLVLIVLINLVAYRLRLGWTGSIILCAVVAFSWPFVATWWSRRKR